MWLQAPINGHCSHSATEMPVRALGTGDSNALNPFTINQRRTEDSFHCEMNNDKQI